jgi:FkbM family methyltransferase
MDGSVARGRSSYVPALLVAIVFMACIVTVLAMRARPNPLAAKVPVLSDELAPLIAEHGPKRYSSHNEEIFVRDFFAGRKGGFFVDVGASHYQVRSNTYYLEKYLNWEGIAIDPISDFAEDYRRFRPRTRFFALFVSDQSDATAKLYVGRNSLFSSADERFTSRFTDVTDSIESPTITLTDLLGAEQVERIDFLTMDIELAEPKALAGFDIERFQPALVCIEAHPEVRQEILDYFTGHRYVVVAKYLRADPQNLWFRPLQAEER